MKRLLPLLALLLGACASIPDGPSHMALPGSGRNFDSFRNDDAMCRQYAYDAVGGNTAERAQADAGVRSAVVGTVIGAAAGAAAGGSHGAAVGAGAGLLLGSAAGAGQANASAGYAQQRYDNAYTQCMYAQGHKVPVSGRFASAGPDYRDSYPAPRYRGGSYYGPPPSSRTPPARMPPPPPYPDY